MTLTYAELKTAIQDYTENTETTFVNNLPLFIRLTEERILKQLDMNLFQKNQTGNMTTGQPYLAAPSDFLAPRSLSIDAAGNKVFLEFKQLDFVQAYNPDDTSTGQPKYYAQFDVDNFILGPTPDADYVVDIHYLYRPTSLTAGLDNGTTWLSENAEVALLYGALMEAYIFMKGEADLVQQYTQQFVSALSRLKNLGEAQERVDEFREGQLRIPRT